jgi:hypothetical protein
VELIAFPDTDGGAIGPITSAKLRVDFVNFASKAKRYYAKPDALLLRRPESSRGCHDDQDVGDREQCWLYVVFDCATPHLAAYCEPKTLLVNLFCQPRDVFGSTKRAFSMRRRGGLHHEYG